jgi:N-dimethylarginine dimethylaminohydrolase
VLRGSGLRVDLMAEDWEQVTLSGERAGRGAPLTLSAQSEVGAIRRMVVKHASEAFQSQQIVDAEWRNLEYQERPDFARAVSEYGALIAALESFRIELHMLPRELGVGLDSIYVRDASVVCDAGVILCNMGKLRRRAEPAAQGAAFAALGVEVLGSISGPGTLEGGDVVWLDRAAVAVGLGRRTNEAGLEQLRDMLGHCVEEVVAVRLPDWRGPGGVFHLMSIVSPIDDDLALVYSPLMPRSLREALLARGYELIEVPSAEFHTMGCNVLAIAPRKCLMLEGNPVTRARLERAGAEVSTYGGCEISLKGAGGPTCLTRPIVREVGRVGSEERTTPHPSLIVTPNNFTARNQ